MICWRSSSGSTDIVNDFEATAIVDTVFWEAAEQVARSSRMFWICVRLYASDTVIYEHLDWPKDRDMKVTANALTRESRGSFRIARKPASSSVARKH